MATTVKRSQFKSFLNTGTEAVPVWSLIGDGVTTARINYTPQTSEEVYIHQDSANIEVESYKPAMPLRAVCKAGDAAWDFIDGLRQSRAVLSANHTDIVNVWLYETPTAGEYPAERQDVSVQVDDFGGDGGKSLEINYTLNFLGDPIVGTFNPTTLIFTAS